MDNIVITDDDRQTPSTGQSSSDDISIVTTENLLPVYEDDQRQVSSMNSVRVCSVKVNNLTSAPNLKIKHPCLPDDNENDPFNDEKRIIIDEHVKVSHIKRSSLDSLNTNISFLRLDACSRRRNTGNVSVSRVNERISHSINGNLNNRDNTQMTFRQCTVRINRISTAANINQGSNQEVIVSKPMVTRVSLSNELSLKMKQKELHVSVKHVSVNPKKAS